MDRHKNYYNNNSVISININNTFRHTVKPLEEIAYEKIYKPAFASRGKSLPLYNEVVNNGSLMFLNSHLSFGEPNSLPANFKYIGGYHIETPIKPLPQVSY